MSPVPVSLDQWWAALWTFARVEGVEPTNNVAERALRPAVLWRTGSFDSESEAGSRFVERLLIVAATCRQQGRRLLDFLVAVWWLRGKPYFKERLRHRCSPHGSGWGSERIPQVYAEAIAEAYSPDWRCRWNSTANPTELSTPDSGRERRWSGRCCCFPSSQ